MIVMLSTVADTQKPGATAETISPYPGLRPFERHERDFFFGRDRDAELLSNKIFASRLTLLFGQSGRGKSSLLRTLLIPQMEAEGARVFSFDEWAVPEPLPILAERLATILQTKAATFNTEDLAAAELENSGTKRRSKGGIIIDLLRRLTAYDPRPLVIVLDQFEELLLRHSNSIETVRRELAALVRDRDIDLKILISLREEFLAALEPFRRDIPGLFDSTYRLERLSAGSLAEAIFKPASRLGVAVDSALVETLIRDLERRSVAAVPTPGEAPGNASTYTATTEVAIELPMLQLVMAALWKEAVATNRRDITLDLYRTLGGWRHVLATYVQQVTPVSYRDRLLLARLLQYLAPSSGYKSSYSAEDLRAITGLNGERIQRELDRLSRAGIVRVREFRGKNLYELQHDSLIDVLAPWRDGVLRGWRQTKWAVGTAAALVLVACLSFLVVSRSAQQALLEQQTASARDNFKLALTSANSMLKQVKESFDRGTITVRGANEMLQVAKSIVDDVRNVENTPATIALLVSYYHNNSDIQADLGQYKEARENAEIAKDRYVEPLLRENQDNSEVLFLLYGSLWRIADTVDARGSGDAARREALKGYLDAEKLAQRLTEPTRHRELMSIHHKIGDMYQALRDPNRALDEYRAAQAFIDALTARDSNKRDWRRDAANAKRRVGQGLEALGDFQGALDEFMTALKALTVLANEGPDDTIVWANLATNHREIAQLHAQQGDLASAAEEFETGIAILERLQQRDRENATRQKNLAAFYSGLAGTLKRQGELAGALKYYRKAYDVHDELANKDPASDARQIGRAKAGIALADVLPPTNENVKERLDLYEEALKALYEPRYKPRYERDVFHCYEAIGDIRLAANDLDNAFSEYNLAWAVARESAAANPATVFWQRSLVTVLVKIGDVLVRQEHLRKALDHYQQALDILAELTAKYPKNPGWPAGAESVRVKVEAIRAKI
jgi:tetratricopeptide (TPR) repeat protein